MSGKNMDAEVGVPNNIGAMPSPVRRATAEVERPRLDKVVQRKRVAALAADSVAATNIWPRGVTVSTLDSESSDRGSNPREALLMHSEDKLSR